MMSPFDDTAGIASEQSSLEVLKRPLVAALTPKMSDAAIRASLQNLHDSVLPLSGPDSWSGAQETCKPLRLCVRLDLLHRPKSFPQRTRKNSCGKAGFATCAQGAG